MSVSSSGCSILFSLQVTDDVTLSAAHNLASKSLKTGITYNTKISGKKTTIKGNYVTKGKLFTGEVVSQLAHNKKATFNFNDKQVRKACY